MLANVLNTLLFNGMSGRRRLNEGQATEFRWLEFFIGDSSIGHALVEIPVSKHEQNCPAEIEDVKAFLRGVPWAPPEFQHKDFTFEGIVFHHSIKLPTHMVGIFFSAAERGVAMEVLAGLKDIVELARLDQLDAETKALRKELQGKMIVDRLSKTNYRYQPDGSGGVLVFNRCLSLEEAEAVREFWTLPNGNKFAGSITY